VEYLIQIKHIKDTTGLKRRELIFVKRLPKLFKIMFGINVRQVAKGWVNDALKLE